MRSLMQSLALAAILAIALSGGAGAQEQAAEYATSPPNDQTGQAPGLKATEMSPRARTFRLVFSKGDNLEPGLAEFANKGHLTDAHFTAVGALDHAVIGWSDRPKKAFKVVRLDEEMEVASLTGDITRDRDGKAVVHVHCVVALLRNGAVYAGHLLEGRVSLTMQLYMTSADPLAPAAAN